MTRPGSFRLPLLALLPALAFAATSSLASAQETSVKLRDSFPIGSGEGTLCQGQDRSYENAAKQSIFDRSWPVGCRVSARAIGNIFVLHSPKHYVQTIV